MNEKQITLVQESFELVRPISTEVARLFYDRLFDLNPDLRNLFKSDTADQQKKLMITLGYAVGALRKPETLLPKVKVLGKTHAGYGVQPEHYELVGQALLWTLATGLGQRFTAEIRDAWAAAYWLLAATMKEGAAGRHKVNQLAIRAGEPLPV